MIATTAYANHVLSACPERYKRLPLMAPADIVASFFRAFGYYILHSKVVKNGKEKPIGIHVSDYKYLN